MPDSPHEIKSGEKVVAEGKEVERLPVPTEAELLGKLASLGAQMRDLIIVAKRLPRAQGLEPHQDSTRSLALSQQYLQTGFMWLKRAISPTKDF